MVSRLIFLDDNMLLFKGDGGCASQIQELLDIYCAISGQHVNRNKSSIFFCKGCPNNKKFEIKEILNVVNP
jgi:hypothetical protein